jgi:hypothetical protein
MPKMPKNVAAGFSLRSLHMGDLWRKLKLAATKKSLTPKHLERVYTLRLSSSS